MNLENICYIVGAASLDGVRLSPRPGDYVIAADGGYRTLKARGIEPDFVMGDFDSLGYRPDHPNVETHPVMKDDTDTDHYSEYLEDYEITNLVKKYSDYIRFPITVLESCSNETL
mgnify:FL=1